MNTKKTLCCVIAALMLALTACGENPPETTSPAEAPTSAAASTDVPVANATDAPATPQGNPEYSSIDLDISAMPASISYPLVVEMYSRMNQYEGQVVKITGTFALNEKETLDEYYYLCNIRDVTACCTSGLEFILAGDPPFPEGYPAEGSQITIVGRFELYEEDEYIFPQLGDAVILECTPPET